MEDEIEKQDINDQENVNGNANDADTLSAIAKQAASDESSGIGGTDSPDQEAEEEELSPDELMFLAVRLSADIFAPLWDIQDHEAMKLAEAYGKVLKKYAPGLAGSVGVEGSAIVATVMVLGSRIMSPRTQKQLEEMQAKEAGEKKPIEHQQAANDPQPPKKGGSILDVEETVDGVKLH